MNTKTHSSKALFGAATLALLVASSTARPNDYSNWLTLDPVSASGDNVTNGTGAVCQLCHASDQGGDGWNGYGWRIRQNLNAGDLLDDAILNAEPSDSDMDPTGALNLAEITADTQPGWTPGSNNTHYFKNLNTVPGQAPPTILGDLDPSGCDGDIDIYCIAKTNSCVSLLARVLIASRARLVLFRHDPGVRHRGPKPGSATTACPARAWTSTSCAGARARLR